MPSATTTPSQIPTTHPDIPPFPSPSTFSILPDVYLLIARLNILQSQQAPGSQQTQSQTQTQSQSQVQTHQPSSSSTTVIGASQSQPRQTTFSATSNLTGGTHTQQLPPPPLPSTQTATNTAPLTSRHIQTTGPAIDAKELPAHIYPIKQKLVKARSAVSTLPDLDRTVDEQEAEIRLLLRDVALLKARLAKLGGIACGGVTAGTGGAVDASMQGGEG
ncbi:uncharacterized protein A1O9_00648 [Exophiala aquamarina CBS 119918]|uniref:Mediator of RNA polymerase II transcription subunit 9 n=1 Tax=Exophiala aquamarina CBS 119918 TaxID=1182545 RepID=A0A072Q436_9EURO|nr:uncharacterized protein A1O9_00648 [Exophiala aquamarina CBS 119918]KEF62675.1 hypothetical protein A1O9_00648 [Exophiala aquamarina CBS 119918]